MLILGLSYSITTVHSTKKTPLIFAWASHKKFFKNPAKLRFFCDVHQCTGGASKRMLPRPRPFKIIWHKLWKMSPED